MGQVFKTQRKVRFGECDVGGVVYYPNYFNWFHETMEVWFEEALGCPYVEVLKDYGFPTVDTSASYRAPVLMGELVDIHFSIERLGTSSIRFQIVIMGPEQKVRTVGMVQVVCISINNGQFKFQSSPLPDVLREKMSPYLGGIAFGDSLK
jgi:4-hydroxybenzoyl-CoA thioesterase